MQYDKIVHHPGCIPVGRDSNDDRQRDGEKEREKKQTNSAEGAYSDVDYFPRNFRRSEACVYRRFARLRSNGGESGGGGRGRE